MVNVNDKVLLKLIWLAGRRRCLISPVQQRVKWKWLHGPEQEMSIPEMSICSWAEPAGLQGPRGFCQDDHGGRKMREKGVARWRPFIQRPEWINENWLKMADQRRLLEQCPPLPFDTVVFLHSCDRSCSVHSSFSLRRLWVEPQCLFHVSLEIQAWGGAGICHSGKVKPLLLARGRSSSG